MANEIKNNEHKSPAGDCVYCCDEINPSTYVEYRAVSDGPWFPSVYCSGCLKAHFIESQWAKYLENVEKADCAAALRRLLSCPPPLNVKDAGLPCKDNGHNDEVQLFWYSSTKSEGSAKLKDSLEGEARLNFWQEKKNFLAATELAEEVAAQNPLAPRKDNNNSPAVSPAVGGDQSVGVAAAAAGAAAAVAATAAPVVSMESD